MKVSVWETFVTRKDGKEMHFGIIVPETFQNQEKILEYGLDYLQSKTFDTWGLSASSCKFCHVEESKINDFINAIHQKGYAIKEIENCE